MPEPMGVQEDEKQIVKYFGFSVIKMQPSSKEVLVTVGFKPSQTNIWLQPENVNKADSCV